MVDDHNLEGDIHIDGDRPYGIARENHRECSESAQHLQAAALYSSSLPTESTPGSNADSNTTGSQGQLYRNTGWAQPGKHSQRAHEATMESVVYNQATQQSEAKLEAQETQYCQVANADASQGQGEGPSAPERNFETQNESSHVSKLQVEECITRLLTYVRQDSSRSGDVAEDIDHHLPVAEVRADGGEMDEDENLLNSAGGAKLTRKERRQLRNKVSARAFRSKKKRKSFFRCVLPMNDTNANAD